VACTRGLQDIPLSSYVPVRLLNLIDDLKSQYPSTQHQEFVDLSTMLRAVCLISHDKGAPPLHSPRTPFGCYTPHRSRKHPFIRTRRPWLASVQPLYRPTITSVTESVHLSLVLTVGPLRGEAGGDILQREGKRSPPSGSATVSCPSSVRPPPPSLPHAFHRRGEARTGEERVVFAEQPVRWHAREARSRSPPMRGGDRERGEGRPDVSARAARRELAG
jgi:hypothetical protein